MNTMFVLLPKIAEFSAAHTLSLWEGSSCQPTGLSQGFEYANKLNASYTNKTCWMLII